MSLRTIFFAIVLIVFSVLVFFFFIKAIVNRKNTKKLLLYLTLSSLSFLLSICIGLYTSYLAINKIIGQDSNEIKSEQSDLLKSYSPDSLSKEIPESFYTYTGWRDWYRLPLVYPFSINCVDSPDKGTISDETNVKNIEWSNDGAIQLNTPELTMISFDQNFLIGKYLDNSFGNIDSGYVIFDFNSQSIQTFKTKEQLTTSNELLNFSGGDSLISIREYYNKF